MNILQNRTREIVSFFMSQNKAQDMVSDRKRIDTQNVILRGEIMKKADIKVSFSKNKLNATILHLDKKGLDFQAELEDSIQKLYEKHVPILVREYIESSEEIENSDKKKTVKTGTKSEKETTELNDTNNFENERKH